MSDFLNAPYFKWNARQGSSAEEEFAVREISFGDNYKETTADGLNSRTASYDVVVENILSESDPRPGSDRIKCKNEIVRFIREKKGTTPFYLALEHSETVDLVTAKKLSIDLEEGNLWTISFEAEISYARPNVYQRFLDYWQDQIYVMQDIEDAVHYRQGLL